MEKPNFFKMAIDRNLYLAAPEAAEMCEIVWNTHVVPLQEKAKYWEQQYADLGKTAADHLEYANKKRLQNETLESESKALREENLRLQNRVSSLENICEMDRKTEYQYNQLYKEKEALRDQLEACEQHNKILCEQKVELLKEIERLKINQPPFR